MEKYLQQEKSNCLKVVLFGPESTGKSSLAKELAVHYNTFYVDEFARNYLQEKWDKYQLTCELKDIIPIAKGQIKNENIIAKKTTKILFCDTDLLTTATYSKLYFNGYCDPDLQENAIKNHYDLYLLMDIDIPWVKDDLRDRPNDRKVFFNSFKNSLDLNKKNYALISGNFQKRKEMAIDLINNLLNLQ
jgi:NadR type nicotinamide-nucleotide adenylyltransferase